MDDATALKCAVAKSRRRRRRFPIAGAVAAIALAWTAAWVYGRGPGGSGSAWPEVVDRFALAWVIQLQAFLFVWSAILLVLDFFHCRSEHRAYRGRVADLVDGARPCAVWTQQDSDDLAVSFGQDLRERLAFANFACWVLPVLGFVGTVVGVTDAIVQLEQMTRAGASDAAMMRNGMAGVLDGLKFAFDTTLSGLLLTIPLMGGMMWLRTGVEGWQASLFEALATLSRKPPAPWKTAPAAPDGRELAGFAGEAGK